IESGKKNKKVAEKYGLPANTVSTILKNKESIITSFETGATSGHNKTMKNVNKTLFEWFTAAINQNMPISGALLKGKAMEFAKRFGDENFKASKSFLDKWKQKHSVSHKKVCCESNDVLDEDCEEWKTTILPILLEKYNECNIFNAYETDFVFQCNGK
ncbi:PREDICTED: tigger transposable element-derived protein 4-like, partial [Rhagoletis zephyria]|uniref:tigger transposable element-derived protein 4-like n=1 Tax=Rhagoletis zephyria TaxID=28612 RepID=UPI0008118484